MSYKTKKQATQAATPSRDRVMLPKARAPMPKSIENEPDIACLIREQSNNKKRNTLRKYGEMQKGGDGCPW